MKYWWCIFDNVLSVPGTQLGPNECIPVEVCTPVCPEQGWGGVGCRDSEKPGLCLEARDLSPPLSKCPGRGRKEEKRKSTTFLTCSALN